MRQRHIYHMSTICLLYVSYMYAIWDRGFCSWVLSYTNPYYRSSNNYADHPCFYLTARLGRSCQMCRPKESWWREPRAR